MIHKNLKKLVIIYICFVFFTTIFVNINVDRAKAEDDSLIAYWSFDESSSSTLFDFVGSNDGTIYGNPARVKGVTGYALDFDGVNDYVIVPDNDVLDLDYTDFTVSFWCYPKDSGYQMDVLFKAQPGVNHDGSWAIRNDISENIWIFQNLDTTEEHPGYNPTETPLNEWSMVTMTYDDSSGSFKTYINGVLDFNTIFKMELRDTTRNLYIGSVIGSHAFFKGTLDEIRIYHSQLSSSEVLDLYNQFKPEVDSNLIAYWNFDEGTGDNFYDSSENGNDGTRYGADWTTGISGYALSLDGIDDYANVPDSTSLDVIDDITISAWVYCYSMPGTAPIISKGNYGTNFGYYLATGEAFSGGCANLQLANKGTGYINLNGINPLNIGQWYHLTGVRNGNIAKIYVNGVFENSMFCFSDSIRENDLPLEFGTHWEGGLLFDGKIDEVRIYNYALSDSEIENLYEQDKPDSELVAYWSFDDSDDVGHDDSGNGNDGTIYEATWTSSGKSSGALNFDGLDDYMQANNPFIFDTSFTISAWIKADDLSERKTIITTTNSEADADVQDFEIKFNNVNFADDVIEFCKRTASSDPDCDIVVSDPITTYTWYHVVAVYDSTIGGSPLGKGALKIYLNNILNDDTPIDGNIMEGATSWDQLTVGITDRGYAFDGIIDEVRIYNRILSASEIKTLYENTESAKPYYVAYIDDYPGNIYVAEIGYPGNWVSEFDKIDITPSNFKGKCGNVDISSGGKKIVFGYIENDNWNIVLGDLNYKDNTIENILNIASSDKREEDPKFSWDNNLIVYKNMSTTSSDADIYTYNILSGKTEIVNDSTYEDWAPFFSPDGNSIIFTRREIAEDDTSDEIYYYDYKTDTVTNLTDNSVSSWYAVFVTNNKLIFIKNDDLYSYNFTNDAEELVYNSLFSDVDPYPLKNDTDYIVFLSDAKPYNLYVYNFEAGLLDPTKLSDGIDMLGPSVFKPEEGFTSIPEKPDDDDIPPNGDEPGGNGNGGNGGGAPGFEAIAVIIAIGIVLLLLKRRK